MNETLRWLNFHRRRLAADRRAFAERARWQAQGVLIAPTVLLMRDEGATLTIGDGTTIADYCLLHLQRDPTDPIAPPCALRIGRRTAINEYCNLRASGGEVRIGDNCLIAQFVSIIGSNHSTSPGLPMRDQKWETGKRGVTIGDDVWLGAGVVVLPGVTIGSGSIVGAGSVVTRDVPEGVLTAGVPARIVRHRA